MQIFGVLYCVCERYQLQVARPCSEGQTCYRGADQGVQGATSYKALLFISVSDFHLAVLSHSSLYVNLLSETEYPRSKRGGFSPMTTLLISSKSTSPSSSTSQIQVTRLCSVHKNLLPSVIGWRVGPLAGLRSRVMS